MSSYMLPGFASDYRVNSSHAYAIFFGNSFALASFGYSLANELDLFFGQLRQRMRLALHTWMIIATFVVHIVNVVGHRTQKQVVRIDAVANVAAMAYKQSVRNFAKVDFPRKTVGLLRYAAPLDNAIASRFAQRSPEPTIVWSCNLHTLPEVDNGIAWTTAVFVMARNIALRYSLDGSALAVRDSRGLSFLTATALAITVRDFIRGMIGVHQNLQFWCQGRGRLQRRSAVSIGFTRVIIPQIRI